MSQRLVALSSSGKKPATLAAYADGCSEWAAFAAAAGWPWRLDDLPAHIRQRRLAEWLAYMSLHGVNTASAARQKLTAVRWRHVTFPYFYGNPLDGTDGVYDLLKNWKKLDGPAACMLPLPRQLLDVMALMTDRANPVHNNELAGILTAFWFCLRSAEYTGGTGFRLQDAVFRDAAGRVLSAADILARFRAKLPVDVVEMTLAISSGKNAKITHTRTLQRSGDRLCCVAAVLSVLRQRAELPAQDPRTAAVAPLFQQASGAPITRARIAQWVKAAAADAGLDHTRYSTHSLRRGGASCWSAAGAPRLAVKAWGRWSSDAYEGYVFSHSAAMDDFRPAAAVAAPRFERN